MSWERWFDIVIATNIIFITDISCVAPAERRDAEGCNPVINNGQSMIAMEDNNAYVAAVNAISTNNNVAYCARGTKGTDDEERMYDYIAG